MTEEDEKREREFKARPPPGTPAYQSYPFTPIGEPSSVASPGFSRASSIDREGSLGPDGGRRVLRIKRLVGHLSGLFQGK